MKISEIAQKAVKINLWTSNVNLIKSVINIVSIC